MSFKRYFKILFLLIGITFLINNAVFGQLPIYLDSKQPIDKRIEDLLSRMTLEEKIGQINIPCVYIRQLGGNIPSKFDGCKRFAEGIYVKQIGPGGEFFTLANTILHEGTRQQAEFFNEPQKIAIEKTRLKIPLIEVEEGTHGLMCSGGTVFPEDLAIGSTWNMDLVKNIYSTAAEEARAVDIHELFTLVIEPIRDPRLGRNIYLNELSKSYKDRKLFIIIGQAGWYKSKNLIKLKNIQIELLPVYSSKLNPVEKLWQYLRRQV